MKEYLSTADGVRQMWNKINNVLDNFDFNKVVIVMEALDWRWRCTKDEADTYSELGLEVKGDTYSPEVPQLLRTARDRLVGAIESMPDDEIWWCEDGGGFRAEVSICTDKVRKDYYGDSVADVDDFEHSVDLRLSFDIEESTSY